MKIKDIILFICMLPIFLLSSCVNDDLDNSQCGTVDLVLTTDFVQTKAASGYSYASGEELKIYDCVVAIYDTNGSQIAFASRNFSGTSTETIGGKPAYRFSNVTSKTGAVTIWVIANSGLGDAAFQNKTIAEIKALNVQTATFDASRLVKVGSTEATLSTNGGSINVELTQLAARVDVSFKTTDTNWKFKMASIAVDKVNQKSDLVLGTYSTSSYTYNTKLQEVSYNGNITSDTVSFYTYEKVTASSPVVIKIKGELKEGTSPGEIKEYTINLNPTIGGSVTTNGIIHGNLYDVSGNIDITTKNVTFDVTVKPWIPIDINASIKDVHYLFVSEHLVYMSNISNYSIPFAADLTVNLVGKVVSNYEDYYLDGNIIKKRYKDCTGSQIPFIEVDNVNKILKITSSIPTNYFPKNITFTVSNGNGLSETVNIIQYPPQYLEGIVSAGAGPKVAGDPNNPNLFTITTISSTVYPIGDPTKGSKYTAQDEESNRMISPKFMVASRYGTVYNYSYTSISSVTRCQEYWETLDKNKTGSSATYPTGTWRVPTLAELEFMNTIQDNNPFINYLFNSDGNYWSARLSWYFDFGANRAKNSDSRAFIRCVHDVY